MTYKVVPFSAAITNAQDTSHLVLQVQSIIDREAAAGWEYINVTQLQTFKAGSKGCFGLGATPPIAITTEFIVFRQ
jgi:hypothetical protein